MIKLRIVWSDFLLKMIMGRSICLQLLASKRTATLPEERTTHSVTFLRNTF